jgi:hypothetical protein
MFLPHRKHTYGPPRPVTEIALVIYTYMLFLPHRKHTYGPSRPVTRIARYLYVDDVPTSQETHLRASTACYRGSFSYLYVDDVPTPQETHLRASTACYEDSSEGTICIFTQGYNPALLRFQQQIKSDGAPSGRFSQVCRREDFRTCT